MSTRVEIKLPTALDRQIGSSPIQIIKNKPDPIRTEYEPSSVSSTPPGEFFAILKKRMEIYYSNPSIYNKNN